MSRHDRPRENHNSNVRGTNSNRGRNPPRNARDARIQDRFERDPDQFADDGEQMYSSVWKDQGRDQFSRPYDENYEAEEGEDAWRPRRTRNHHPDSREHSDYRENSYGRPNASSYGTGSSHEFGDYGQRYQTNQAPKDWYEDTNQRPRHKNSYAPPSSTKRWEEPTWGGMSPGEPNYSRHTSVSPSSISKSYWGVGPKGYKRADERIHEDICSRLAEDHHLDASEIIVEVSEGEVFLRGKVEDRRAKRHAEEIAEHVTGAINIINELRVFENIRSMQDFGDRPPVQKDVNAKKNSK